MPLGPVTGLLVLCLAAAILGFAVAALALGAVATVVELILFYMAGQDGLG